MVPYEADNWREVESSNIKAVGTRDHYLIVQFNKGGSYRYPNCASQFDDLINAESVGRYFAVNIKPTASYDKLPSEVVGWPED
jgi:hypothetical protein